MKKSIFVSMLLLALSTISFADDVALKNYISSPTITHLLLKIDNNSIKYNFLTKFNNKPDGVTISGNGIDGKNFIVDQLYTSSLPILIHKFNPLIYSVSVDSIDEKDPAFETGSFFDAFDGYKGLLVGTTKEKSLLDDESIIVSELTEPTQPKVCNEIINEYNVLIGGIYNVDDNGVSQAKKLIITKKDIIDWSVNTDTENGIKTTIKLIDGKIAELKTNIDKIKSARENIEKTKGTDLCKVPAEILAATSYVMTRASEAISQRESFVKFLSDLNIYLKKFDNWQGDYYVAGAIDSPAGYNLKKITISKTNYQYEGENSKLLFAPNEKEKSKITFTIHKKEKFIIDSSVALLVSPMKYNKFSTKTVGGNQIVEKTEYNDPAHIAAVLNFLPTTFANEVMSPFAQIGVSTAKEYPAIVLGLGGKMFSKPFAIAAGFLVGFDKELSSLKEGSVVPGQADIDKDLKTVIDPSWYLSIQYNFE